MAVVFTIAFFGICITAINGQACEDLDTDVCKRLSAMYPEMCSDSCYSSICTRFCRRCPLKCYTCHEVDHPANCTTLVDCPSNDHYCFTTQTFNDDFQEVYKMGCAMKDVCVQQVSHGKRSDLDVKGACCNIDKCNNLLPQQIDLLPVPTTVPLQNTTARPPIYDVCENNDDDICLRISLTDPLFCSNDCIASNICPRMCRKCFQCYDCNDINRPEDCNHTSTCQAGKECFQLETLSFDLRPVFRLGCLDESLCQRFRSPVQTGFGRRQTISLKGGCCKTDLCNGKINKVVTTTIKTTTTTKAPTTHHQTINCAVVNHHCPEGYEYFLHQHSCFHVGNTMMTQSESQNYCKNHCGRLADFDTENDLKDVLQHLDKHRLGVDYWVDVGKDTRGRWIWTNNHLHIDSSLSIYLGSSHSHTYACASAISSRSSSHVRLHAEDCSNRHQPLCEAPRMDK